MRANGSARLSSPERRGFECAALLIGLTCAWACGGRTPLTLEGDLEGSAGSGGAGVVPRSCVVDLECEIQDACRTAACVRGVCLEALVDCDDGNPCTEDSCDAARGCQHRSLVTDADRDGHPGPRPGFLPGMVDACGDDCDDQNRQAFPGNAERCDGLDNDCNGVIDDGSVYAARGSAIRISLAEDLRASLGGLSATSSSFVLSYSARRGSRSQNFLTVLDPSLKWISETPIASVNTDSFAGPLAFSGSSFATAWEDARQDTNYEIYFATFDQQGKKLGPDLRVSDAPGFSLNPRILWNQSEYLLIWDDRRAERAGQGDLARIYGQRIASSGARLGDNVLLTPNDPIAEFPDIALGPRRFGLAFVSSNGIPRLVFRVLDESLAPVGERPDPIGENVQSPSVYWLGDRFIVLFNTYDRTPGEALWGAAFDLEGRLLLAPRRLTEGARFARSHDALALGDRLLVVWADDRDGNYELYSQLLGRDFGVLAGRQRLTDDPAASLGPLITRGPNGQIGVAFTDYRTGSNQTYMLTLGCR